MIQSGTITDVRNCGSIVMVMLRTAKGWLVPVCFDHRSFGHLLGSENCGADELIGRPARFDGEKLNFLDAPHDRN